MSEAREVPVEPTARCPCAGAVITDDGGRILLVRRARPPAAGSWSLPGGRVEPGESAAAAAAREVLEETGLTVAVGSRLITATAGDYLIEDFAARVVGGALRAGDDAAEARWWPIEQLSSLDLSPGLLEHLQRAGIA